MKKKVVILMSTYNGEKYIDEQINSIIQQDYDGNITLQIRDDGSTDRTLEKIRVLAEKNNEGRKIVFSEGDNLGPQRSFLNLIKEAYWADYYFFSDQDDIWLKNKIRIAVQHMERNGNEPVCYCSNYSLCDASKKIITKNAINGVPPFRPLKIIFYNQIPGCTMGFNHSLMESLRKIDIDNVMMHDSMALSLAACIGSVIYDNESRIIHRIHEENVVGTGHKKIIFNKWIIEKIKLIKTKEKYDLSLMAEKFLQTGKIKNEWVNDLTLLKNYKNNYWNTIRILMHKDSHDIFCDRTTMSIICKILFHIF